jgi:hypothetical protein
VIWKTPAPLGPVVIPPGATGKMHAEQNETSAINGAKQALDVI